MSNEYGFTFSDNIQANRARKARNKLEEIGTKHTEYIDSQVNELSAELTQLKYEAQRLEDTIIGTQDDDPNLVGLTNRLKDTEVAIQETLELRDGVFVNVQIQLNRLTRALKQCYRLRWYDDIIKLKTSKLDKLLGKRNREYAVIMSAILNIKQDIKKRIDKIHYADGKAQEILDILNGQYEERTTATQQDAANMKRELEKKRANAKNQASDKETQASTATTHKYS